MIYFVLRLNALEQIFHLEQNDLCHHKEQKPIITQEDWTGLLFQMIH